MTIAKSRAEQQDSITLSLEKALHDTTYKKDSIETLLVNARSKIVDDEDQLNSLTRRAEELVAENFHSHLKVKDVNIISVSENSFRFSFKVLDKNYQPIQAKIVPITLQIKKLNTSANSFDALKWKVNGLDYCTDTFSFPKDSITVDFEPSAFEFTRAARNKGQYELCFYNKFDDIIEKSYIYRIPAGILHEKRPHEIEERKTIYEKDTLFVESDNLRVSMSDNVYVDGDVVSAYLNGEIQIDADTLRKKPKSDYKLTLTEDVNELLLYANYEGQIPRCSIKLDIVCDENKVKSYNLELDKKTNKVIIIARKHPVEPE